METPSNSAPLNAAVRVLASLLGALGGAALSSLVVARLDVQGVGNAALALAALGVIAPLAAVVALGVWALRLVFWSGDAWPVVTRFRQLGAGEGRAAWLVGPPFLALGVPPLLLAAAGVAARGLGVENAGRGAMAWLALSFLALAVALLASMRVVTSALGPRLTATRLDPRLVAPVSALVLLGAVALLVALGETGGGGGPLRMLGVLRRQELDLRPPGLLLLLALAAVLWPRPTRLWQAGVSGLACVLALLAGWKAGKHLTEHEALTIERSAPLARIGLGLLRRLSDRDHDGVSAAFAGGDCNDHDAAVSPRAIDVPGNGKDEDCSGSDAALPAPDKATAASSAAGQGARDQLPSDLNVVLVTIDTLRADLGYAGNPRPVSPTLDALARQSVVFERAYSLASYTGKSMGPLMIGKYSSELEGGFAHFNRYPKSETFVQERLHAAGIRTMSVQGYWYFFKDAGFERGFDVIDSSAAPKVAAIEGDQTSNSDEQSDAAIKLLAAPELSQQRFFLWMHYVDPHADYAPHPEHDFGPKPRDRYDAEVAFVDAQLGRVLAALEQAPFAAKTALIVSSDHGEAFGEHGMIRHGFELWEELVRVPLLVKVPGIAPRRVAVPRSGIDLVPTLLDLFEVPFEARGPRDFLSGESLLPDLLRAPGIADPERPIFIDMARGPYNAERQALIDEGLKLTVSEGRVLGLYDLSADPGEKNDLAGDKARLQPMKDALSAFKSRLRRVAMPQP